MGEFNQSKYINEFIKETYDTIKVQVPKGQKDAIKEHAKSKGYKSVNEYMKALINTDMNKPLVKPLIKYDEVQTNKEKI